MCVCPGQRGAAAAGGDDHRDEEDGKAARAAAWGQTWRPCLTRAHSFIFILGSRNSSYLLLTARATAYIVCDYDLIHSLFAERIF